MRPLLAIFGAFGLTLGLVSAITVHYLPVEKVGWFIYTPTTGARSYTTSDSISIATNWSPSVWVLPAIGLVLGVLAAIALSTARYQLARR